MKKPLYNLFPRKIFRSSQTNRSGAVTDSKAESNSIRTRERDKDGDTWVIVAASVAGSSGSREDVGQGFWRCSDLLSEKRSLYLLREKVRRQNHEQGSERIGALVFLLGSTK